MAKGHVMGSEPPQDPMKQFAQAGMTEVTDTEIRWSDRTVRPSLTPVVAIVIASIITVLTAPWMVTLVCALGLSLSIISYRIREGRENRTIDEMGLIIIPERDIVFNTSDDSVQSKGVGGTRFSAGFNLRSCRSTLSGDLGRLIRALPTSVGFTLMMRMSSVENNSILEGDVLSDHSSSYLSAISSDRLDTYFTRRGGLWATGVS
ncbi:MAG: hypothetical protein RTU92_02590, partial [Candidatus Thorarchaeota archaeon]